MQTRLLRCAQKKSALHHCTVFSKSSWQEKTLECQILGHEDGHVWPASLCIMRTCKRASLKELWALQGTDIKKFSKYSIHIYHPIEYFCWQTNHIYLFIWDRPYQDPWEQWPTSLSWTFNLEAGNGQCHLLHIYSQCILHENFKSVLGSNLVCFQKEFLKPGLLAEIQKYA